MEELYTQDEVDELVFQAELRGFHDGWEAGYVCRILEEQEIVPD